MSEVYQFATPLKIIYKNDKIIEGISTCNTSTAAVVDIDILAWAGDVDADL